MTFEIKNRHTGNLQHTIEGKTFIAALEAAIKNGVNFSNGGFRYAALNNAILRNADFQNADFSCAILIEADLSNGDFSGADLRGVDFSGATLRGVNFQNADFSLANLSDVDLSGAKNFFDSLEYLKENFEFTSEGIIVYKRFWKYKKPNPEWIIRKGSILNEVCNPLPTCECACGINVASQEWFSNKNNLWKCLIKWEWAQGIVVPYNTTGKIRCSRIKLLKKLMPGEDCFIEVNRRKNYE